MYKFGFELEGFYFPPDSNSGEFTLPPKRYPNDGFAGLVEFRTVGGSDIETAYYSLFKQLSDYPHVSYKTTEHIFNASEKSEIRRRGVYKEQVNVQNLYGKPPRDAGRRTLASFQVNLSNQTRRVVGDKTITVDCMFDMVQFIRSMDKEFAFEIKVAKRQPGMYAIKDGFRLEYRSLPNSVFSCNYAESRDVIRRILSCLPS